MLLSTFKERHRYKVRDLAEMCRVNERTIYNWINAGALAVTRGPKLLKVKPANPKPLWTHEDYKAELNQLGISQ